MLKPLIFLAIFCAFAWPHALKVFVKQNGDKIELQSYFSGNAKCQNCEVFLLTNENEKFLGNTDKMGNLTFLLPAQNFKIKVKAGAGHEKIAEFSANLPARIENEEKNEAVKFIFSLAAILGIFGIIWAIKR